MGGVVSKQYTMATTHIVADSVLSEKCTAAYAANCPVMTVDWIHAVWKESLNDAAHATDSQFSVHACPIFYNLRFCMSQIASGPKSTLRKVIEENGQSCIHNINTLISLLSRSVVFVIKAFSSFICQYQTLNEL
jgi:hypothetical protein